MRRYFFTTPWWVKSAFSQFHWSVPTDEPIIFLTFDDGPDPTATPYVLDLLDSFHAKATFFCVGDQVLKFPQIFQKLLQQGHVVGNHTHSHLNGWKTKNEAYLRDIKLFDQIHETRLFRPPYGKIGPIQQQLLADREIVMWSHMAGDFDQNLEIWKSRKNLLNAPSGSILVFHDTQKAFQNLKELLPEVLQTFSESGYVFKTLEDYALD